MDEFWSHWPDVRADLAASIADGTPVSEETAQFVTERVRRLSPALTWELSEAPPSEEPSGFDGLDTASEQSLQDMLESLGSADSIDDLGIGGTAPTCALILSAGSDDEARIVAERWKRAAPDDPGWRFFAARPADPAQLSKPLTWDGHELDLSHVSVSLRVNQQLATIEAGVYHPDFMFLPDDARQGVAERVVLLALGEDDYVRWIGSVAPLAEKPLDPLPPTSLPTVVHQLSGALGSGGWVTLQGRIPLRGSVQISVRHPLHRRDFPAFTLYVHVSVGYTSTDQDKQPADPSAAALEEYTATLRDIAADNGALFAHQTAGGQRRYHFYLDPDSGVLPAFEQAARTWSESKVQVSSTLDPQWDTINQILKPIRRQLGG
ncbi:uncharacterized protein DUF695 [Murinocardiopsis flavida]|uniref:Uncharacterized protein DUF695 n=1 Tax=Murinocardiopsis flavida TaxID=645275 RepID=A0A2P8DJU2_9ACTN|nr:uncharacterized protein DUF695 [Murinocardiopsis flavida]